MGDEESVSVLGGVVPKRACDDRIAWKLGIYPPVVGGAFFVCDSILMELDDIVECGCGGDFFE